jgi:hypothetical protein
MTGETPMSIEGVGSYAEIYSENLTDEDIKTFDNLGVEWRGRNIYAIRDDFCVKAVTVFARLYAQTALINPAELPQLKAEIIEVFEDLFDTELEDEDEPSPLLYRFDPLSGTYRELIGAEGKFIKKAGKKVGKGLKKAKKAVTKGVRGTGRWVREHPVETAVIVAAVVVVIATAGAAAPIAGPEAISAVGSAAAAGAAAAASNNGSNSRRKKDSEDEPSSSSPPNPPSQGTPQAVNKTSTYTPNISQGFSTSNPLPQDPFPHKSFSNNSYERSDLGSRNPNSYPAPLGMPTLLAYETKTYSAPASITDIPKSSSYASFKGTPTPMNLPLTSSSSIEHYKPGEFSVPQQVRLNSNDSFALLFPGYQEMPTSPKSSTPPKAISVMNQTQEEPWTDFVKGVSKGFPRGCADSVKEVPSTFSAIVKLVGNYVLDPFINPLNQLPGQETVSQVRAVYETIEYLRICEVGEVRKAAGEFIKAVAPEAHKLFTDWDNLSIEERGDLSAYCTGKYGTDFLLPLAAAKGVKVAGVALKEAGAIGKLEGVIGAATPEIGGLGMTQGSSKLARELNVGNVRELIKAGRETPLLAKELGFTKHDIAHLTQSGDLEKHVATAFENIIRDQTMVASLEKFRMAENFLKPYRSQYLFETHAKELIQQTGIRTYPRPTGVPENFRVRISDKGAGIIYLHPEHAHTSIRIMPGKPHSPLPYQQKPYVIYRNNGNTFDKFGKVVDSSAPESHIPIEEFVFKDHL